MHNVSSKIMQYRSSYILVIEMINKKLLKKKKEIANKYPDIRKIDKAIYKKYETYLLSNIDLLGKCCIHYICW